MCRVCQRTKNIEDSTNADLAPRWANVFHRWMVSGRGHEAEPNLSYATCHLLRTEIDTCPQSFQYISAATATGGRTIAVLCYASSCGCHEDTGSSRDVKSPSTIAACAAGIQSVGSQLPFKVHLYRLVSHDTCHASDFLHSFPAGTQP